MDREQRGGENDTIYRSPYVAFVHKDIMRFDPASGSFGSFQELDGTENRLYHRYRTAPSCEMLRYWGVRKRLLIARVVCLPAVIGCLVFGVSSPPARAAQPGILHAGQAVWDLTHQPRRWEGRVVLVRGWYVGFPSPQCQMRRPDTCPIRGGLSASGTYGNVLTLVVKPSQRQLLVLTQPATYRVRLHLLRCCATVQPEGYLLARVG